VLGPLSVGFLSDVTGGFSMPLYMMSGVCIVLCALLVPLRRYSRLQ